jgi:hypothetical protein
MNKSTKALLPALATLAVTAPAYAAEGDSAITQLYSNAAGQLDGVTSGTLMIITALATVVVLLIGWYYFKRAK